MSTFDPSTNERTVTVTIKMRSSDRLNVIKRFYGNPEAAIPGAEILEVDAFASAPEVPGQKYDSLKPKGRSFDPKTGKMLFK